MSKLLTRLFIGAAAVAGGALALTNSGTAADGLPPVPTSTNPVASAAVAGPDADDLASWQETRVTSPTSNRVPPKRK